MKTKYIAKGYDAVYSLLEVSSVSVAPAASIFRYGQWKGDQKESIEARWWGGVAFCDVFCGASGT